MSTSRGRQDQRVMRSVGLPACGWTKQHLYLNLAVSG